MEDEVIHIHGIYLRSLGDLQLGPSVSGLSTRMLMFLDLCICSRYFYSLQVYHDIADAISSSRAGISLGLKGFTKVIGFTAKVNELFLLDPIFLQSS